MRFSVRLAAYDDKRFIFSTWLLSSKTYLKGICWADRRAAVQALVDSCTLLVCYPNEDADIILGWTAVLRGARMWTYVQNGARGCGIRKMLEGESDATQKRKLEEDDSAKH